MESKKPWASKSLWLALISAVAAFFPSVQHFMILNPEAYAMGIGALFAVLRLVSKDKIVIK